MHRYSQDFYSQPLRLVALGYIRCVGCCMPRLISGNCQLFVPVGSGLGCGGCWCAALLPARTDTLHMLFSVATLQAGGALQWAAGAAGAHQHRHWHRAQPAGPAAVAGVRAAAGGGGAAAVLRLRMELLSWLLSLVAVVVRPQTELCESQPGMWHQSRRALDPLPAAAGGTAAAQPGLPPQSLCSPVPVVQLVQALRARCTVHAAPRDLTGPQAAMLSTARLQAARPVRAAGS